MGRDWEATFKTWLKPASETEQVKSENAERMVRDAISGYAPFSDKNISVFSQGSYKNNTNVRSDSDVDICICCRDIVMQDFSLAPNRNNLFERLQPAVYQYSHLKNDIEKALTDKFNRSNLTRGDKAFDLHENTYRVDADVVPAIESRLYLPNGGELVGTCIVTDSGTTIYNWPAQHYSNGVAKNTATGNKFKFLTRIIKRLRNEMYENGVKEAAPIPSYLIECLVYNVPNYVFDKPTYQSIAEGVIGHVWNMTENDDKCVNWVEVNEIKLLFHWQQKWTRSQANAFMLAAWQYLKLN